MLPALLSIVCQPGTVTLKPGLTVSRSCKVKPGVYTFPSSESNPAIKVSGKNITVDFSGVELRGSSPMASPSERAGTGVVVRGENVTVKGLTVRGYKTGLKATDATGLKIIGGDYSHNWKQHLGSTLEREDEADWMSYHKNEADEWLRYGAAIYLRNCDGFEVKGVKAWGGQNGLMLTGCDNGKVWNNSFCFLSSLGIGMYRSSGNKVMHNNIDWCVRGYSHGVYNRGQDSAGILVYEQSNKNVFAYNSVTHGGDGFFLWAGQSTMDTGKGGCNDNVVFANDFSHAPTNGIEATFSRNTFANNLVLECWHGVWGGYSYETSIAGNTFGLNAEAIAIEHGQDNRITGNSFKNDTTAIKLWANASQDPNWGYPKFRDTRSRAYVVSGNSFSLVPQTVLDFTRTEGILVKSNAFSSFGRLFRLGDQVKEVQFLQNSVSAGADQSIPAEGVVSVGNSIGSAEPGAKPAVSMLGSGLVSPEAEADWQAYKKHFVTSWPGMDIAKQKRPSSNLHFVAPLLGGNDPFKSRPGYERGRRYILVDEWGPYDFQSPRLWPRSLSGGKSNELKFEVLGPRGTWKAKSLSPGVTLSVQGGSVPGFVTATLSPQAANDVSIQLTYTGAATVDFKGNATPAGKPVRFGFSKYFMPIDWTVSHWNYNAAEQDPRTHKSAFDAVLSGKPDATYKTGELNGAWGGSPRQGVNSDYFATVAVGTFSAKPGDFDLTVTSDDGVRVWLDDKLVLDDWTYHGPKTETVKVRLGGKHRLRVEHFELNGYSALKVEVRKRGA